MLSGVRGCHRIGCVLCPLRWRARRTARAVRPGPCAIERCSSVAGCCLLGPPV